MKTISTVFPSPCTDSAARQLYEDAIGFVAALVLVGAIVYVVVKSWLQDKAYE